MTYDISVMQTYGLPVELATQLQELAKTNFVDNFGDAFSRLSLKGSTFSLVSGSSVTQLGSEPLTVVFLGDDPKGNYLAYYAGVYTGADDVKPTAIWYASEPAPSVVPPSVMEKDPRTGKFGYSRRQRTVIALLDNTGVITPVVFDINAVSMFGDNCNLGNMIALSYSNYRRALSKYGVLPCTIATQIILDRSAGIPAVKFLPALDNNGRPKLLPADVLQNVIKVATSKEVADLLKVHKIPEDAPDVNDLAPASQPVAPQPTVAPQVAPQPTVAPQVAPQPAVAPQVAPQPAVAPQVAPQPAVAPLPDTTFVIAEADNLINDANVVLNRAATFTQSVEVEPAPQVAPSPLTDLVQGTEPAAPVLTTSADLAKLLQAAKS